MNRLLIFLLCLSAQHVFSVNWKEKNLSWKTSNKNIVELHSAQFDSSTRKPRAMYKEDISDKQPVNSNIHSILKSRSVANSVLASGKWVKARTNQSGIHKITFASLRSMGFQSPQNVKIFGFPPGKLPQMNSIPSSDDLTQYCVWQTKDKQANDCFLIYVPGQVTWAFDAVSKLFIHSINQFAEGHSYLYLTEDISTMQLVQLTPMITDSPTITVNEFDDVAFYEDDTYNLIETGSRWFSSLLTPNNTLVKTFKFQDHISNEPISINIVAAARCDLSSTLSLSVNNTLIETMSFAPYSNFAEADYANLRENAFSTSVEGDDINFSFKYNSPANGKCWLDYIRMQTRCKLTMQDGQLIFCDSRSVGPGNIAAFRIGNAGSELKIWEITSPLKPFEIQSATTSNILTIKVMTDSLRRFIAFNPLSDFPAIEKVEEVNNQNLHGLSTPDMLIITSPDFKTEAERLALFHRQNSGLEVTVVDVSQIFNEFSGGISDVTAIRNFVRLLYRKSQNNNVSELKYLLLFGKGTYDNLHPVDADNPCFIPTWQSESSLNPASSFVTDDYFGLLGEDEGGQKGNVDIGIGRISCVNAAEAKAVVDKILHYNTSPTMGEWRNNVCFVGDDEDNNIHVSDSEQLANFVNEHYPTFYTDKIYLDAFKEETTPEKRYPEVNKALSNRVKEGALIINYVGHANEEGLAHEKILTISDIDSWSNVDKLPVFVTATCEFSRWDLKNKQSAGEHVLFNKVGGGIALFSTTRLVYSSSNYEMNKSFFKYVFEADKEGKNLRMGDIIRLAKSELGGTINAAKFALLGDPALQISYPHFKVKTLEINNQPIEQLTDTLKPLSLVSVWGEIQNLKGEKITNYNGTLYPTVFDKPTAAITLGNDGQTPFIYSAQNSILFKGNVSVKSGEFSYSFKVPKEINYRVGNGLIRYYSKDATSDAGGSFVTLKIGGSPVSTLIDLTGPTIKLFLDNENFKPGDQVSKAPLLIAYLEDESGIHTSGGGIGHDITATIDNQTDKIQVLNDYFQSDQDSYKDGKVLFQLSDLEDGEHTIKFKAWDLANNSTETEIKFTVASGLKIINLTAYPNPVIESTDIIAVHNRFGEKMTVEIEIFSQQGVLIDQVKTESGSSGFTTMPIRWNPGLNNHNLVPGIFHYRVRLTALDGSTAVKTGQLILTR
ncbi:MAG TPA: type IX secretion system sortase PorU [Prolixibacteraceae bacterium]|nr:type IX secretion system sortase PorU [Prolixibacteraceae bacterium]